MSNRIFKFAVRGLQLSGLCLFATSCAIGPFTVDPVGDALDDRAYKKDVHRYQQNGFDEKTANRKAYENQFFRDMEENQ